MEGGERRATSAASVRRQLPVAAEQHFVSSRARPCTEQAGTRRWRKLVARAERERPRAVRSNQRGARQKAQRDAISHRPNVSNINTNNTDVDLQH